MTAEYLFYFSLKRCGIVTQMHLETFELLVLKSYYMEQDRNHFSEGLNRKKCLSLKPHNVVAKLAKLMRTPRGTAKFS